MKDFAHLHAHSEFSLSRGSMTIDDYLDRLEELNIKHAALTDTHNLFGSFKFFRKARDRDIHPIIGADVSVQSSSDHWDGENKSNRLRLLVIDGNGFENLCQLISNSYSRRRDRGGLWIDSSSLVDQQEGLWILGPASSPPEREPRSLAEDTYRNSLREAQDLFGERFLAEIPIYDTYQTRALKQLQVAGEENIPSLITYPSYFSRKEDFETYRLRLAIQSNTSLADLDEIPDHCRNQYVISPDKIRDWVPNQYHDSLERSYHVAQSCEFQFNTSTLRLPTYPDSSGSCLSMLEQSCRDAIPEKSLEASREEIESRLEHELTIISEMEFTDYFLIVADIVNWAKNNGIRVGPGRGSASGSLVSYLMGITDVDPFEYDLVFERFLNPDRNEMPDIDIDFADHQRDRVIGYIRERFGQDNVAQIITFGNMKAKNSIRDVGRIRDESQEEIDMLASRISGYEDDALKTLKNKIGKDLNQKHGEWIEQAQKLEGFVRNPSIHAAGLLVSDERIDSQIPLYFPDEESPFPATQFDMYDVESLGYLKLDILGLTTLSLLDLTLSYLPEPKRPDLDQLPDSDPKTLELFADASLEGVFQFESEGGRQLAHRMEPQNKREIVDCIALNRPGPAAYRDDYLKRRSGQEPVEYPHEDLEEILEDTYGLIIYQEQVMAIARTIGGFTWAQSDSMRKAMGKKVPELMEEMREEFIQGALDQGYDESFADSIFRKLAKFAEYGFNRSHSAAYGEITYQTAYLKAHYTNEFYAAFLTVKSNNRDRIARINEGMKADGIRLLPPSINRAQKQFIPEKNGVRYGLEAIKHLGNALANAIEEARKEQPFDDLIDFLSRMPPSSLQPKVLQSMAAAGCFRDFEAPTGWIISNAERLTERGASHYRENQSGQENLFQGTDSGPSRKLTFPDKDPWTSERLDRAQKSATGVIFESESE